MKTRQKILAWALVALLVAFFFWDFYADAQETTGDISFQPSEMPNIGFDYNPQEYQFELTWKQFYLNIKPFAIYNGRYYDMKQIIPFLKNQ